MSQPQPGIERHAAVARAFTAHLRDPLGHAAPPDVPEARMALYRELVHANVERMLGNLFPVLHAVLAPAAWQDLVQRFFRDHRSRNGVFVHLPQEFLAFVDAALPGADEPPFLRELVAYEALDHAITTEVADIDWRGVDADGDLLAGVPVLNPLARLLACRFPVHRIAPACQPQTPSSVPTYLVVCRDRHDRVGFMELNPVSARLLELVRADTGTSGADLLARIAAELGYADAAPVVAGGRDILERLRTRDVLLGSRRDTG